MDILLIRHGQSEADLKGVHEGRADFPLTSLGVQQAGLLAEWLRANYLPEVIWTSPLQRARQVADIISSVTTGGIHEHDGLMEWNNGVLAGLTFEEAGARYPEPGNGRRPHESVLAGESEIEFRSRVETAFSQIITESNRYDRIAMVSHGGTISRLLATFLQLPLVNGYRFVTGDTGCHLLVLNGMQRTVKFMNRQDHLVYM